MLRKYDMSCDYHEYVKRAELSWFVVLMIQAKIIGYNAPL